MVSVAYLLLWAIKLSAQACFHSDKSTDIFFNFSKFNLRFSIC